MLSLGDVAVWLPLHSGDELQGLLLIGRRPGGDFFTAEDERILATGAHQAGIAGHEAQRLSRELKPDVLLLDLSMPGPRPAETVVYLHEHYPEVEVLVLTAYDEDAYVRSVVAVGVAGYVLKDEAPATVVAAIRAVRGAREAPGSASPSWRRWLAGRRLTRSRPRNPV